jgi:tetratricopeptide (TPR) repeat protein
MGYALEGWKLYDEAIKVYKEILASNKDDLSTYRDLALAYYQAGNYQEAVTTFYQGITRGYENYEYYKRGVKGMMLLEMNAIIAVHLDDLDLSMINKQLIKPLTAELRVTLDCNMRSLYGTVSVVEPDEKTSSYSTPYTGSNGYMSRNDYYNYYTDGSEEYQVKKAKEGKYKLRVSYSNYGNALKIPTIIRIMTFKNFGKPGQSLEVENVIMDNQYGDVEIAEVKW